MFRSLALGGLAAAGLLLMAGYALCYAGSALISLGGGLAGVAQLLRVGESAFVAAGIMSLKRPSAGAMSAD